MSHSLAGDHGIIKINRIFFLESEILFMTQEPSPSELSPQKAQAISDQIAVWWRDPKNSQLTREEMTELIQQLSGPPAVWYYIPENDAPYNSMETWCEAELDCDADSFLKGVQSYVGEDVMTRLRDRRLSAIFRPLT